MAGNTTESTTCLLYTSNKPYSRACNSNADGHQICLGNGISHMEYGLVGIQGKFLREQGVAVYGDCRFTAEGSRQNQEKGDYTGGCQYRDNGHADALK